MKNERIQQRSKDINSDAATLPLGAAPAPEAFCASRLRESISWRNGDAGAEAIVFVYRGLILHL